MKKIVSIIIAGAIAATMCFALSGCGNNANEKATVTTTNIHPASAVTAQAQDDQNDQENYYAPADAGTQYDDNAYVFEDNDESSFIVTLQNTADPDQGFSANADYATDHYDTASAYFNDLPAGAYEVNVYHINADGSISVCSSTILENTHDGASFRINFYLVVSEIECIAL